MTDLTTFEPTWLSPPGESIADLLEEKGWSQGELALRTGFTRKHINELVSGKASLSPDAALKLESVLGGTARFWLSREARYREALSRQEAEAGLAGAGEWVKQFPLADLRRFGWIQPQAGTAAMAAEILRFFGVASIATWDERYLKPLCAFRASAVATRRDGAIAAWLRQGERVAEQMELAPFDVAGFRAQLPVIRELTREADPQVFVPKVQALGAKVGVAVVFVRTPAGCPVSGATRGLGSDRAVLQLSLRYKTNDQLWFTFFHEAGHLVLHGKKLILEGADGMNDAHEQEANAFARDMLIPRPLAARLPTLGRSIAAISTFAANIGVAPGIVVGRMQHEGLLPFSHLNALKKRYDWSAE